MQNAGTGVLNPVYRAHEHRRVKLDSTPTASATLDVVSAFSELKKISPYGNISVESVSLNTLYVHVYLTIHKFEHICVITELMS